MNDSKRPSCPECGKPLPEGDMHGVCPACLMAQAMASRTLVTNPGDSPHGLPPSPQEIADRFPGFDVLECLGRGGMGVVYKARQKSLDRIVAIKILPPEKVGEERFAEHFEREAKTLAMLSHPNIVTVFDHGRTDGLFYIVMEHIDGVNLRDLLSEGKLEPEQALAIVPPICDALEYAHGKGIVHRDIKPENVLLDRGGRVKIADFGIASLIGASGEKSGTPPYMAPEQESGKVDRRADIYALGVVLYEMLTGERPDRELIAPSKKVRIDVRLDELVLRALENEPERRYQTAAEFRTVVETIDVSPPPVRALAPPPAAVTVPEKPPGMFRRWWWVFLVMVPAGVVFGLLSGAIIYHVVPRKYEAQATLEIRHADGRPQTPAFLAARFDGMKSQKTLEEVSRRLDLPSRWMLADFNVIPVLKGIISIQNIRGTDLVGVQVRHTNPRDAADIANAVVEIVTMEPNIRAVVLERPAVPQAPVSPNLALNLVLAGTAGFFVSPLLGLLVAWILHRLFPSKPAPGSGEGDPPPAGAVADTPDSVTRHRDTAASAPPADRPARDSTASGGALVEDVRVPSARRKLRRKKFNFRLHDRTPSKAALLGMAALCLIAGGLVLWFGEPVWRLITADPPLALGADPPFSPIPRSAANPPILAGGILTAILVLGITLVFSLVLVLRGTGSGAAKGLATGCLVLMLGGTIMLLAVIGLFYSLKPGDSDSPPWVPSLFSPR